MGAKELYYVGIEGGGTKFNCMIARSPEDILSETRIPTTNPDQTISSVISFIDQESRNVELRGIGIGTFGPVDLQKKSPTYGYITATPKPGWSNTDLVGPLKTRFNVPIGFDTDVNAATLGEHLWGAGQGIDNLIYLTIGTGIGGGALVNGQLLHGLLHPEMGHITLRHDLEKDPFPGNCPFHKDCFEGLANGPAMEKRWGQRAETLPEDHPAWDLEAEYIALGVASLSLTLSPELVILGGGVMEHPGLLQNVRVKYLDILNGYLQSERVLKNVDQYLIAPGLGSNAGKLGAVALAIQAAEIENRGK